MLRAHIHSLENENSVRRIEIELRTLQNLHNQLQNVMTQASLIICFSLAALSLVSRARSPPRRRRVARLAPLPPRVPEHGVEDDGLLGPLLRRLRPPREEFGQLPFGGLSDARRLVAERPLAREARLGEASRVPEPDARPLDEFLGPAVDVLFVFVTALPEVGAAAA